jgi:hypothetical protein
MLLIVSLTRVLEGVLTGQLLVVTAVVLPWLMAGGLKEFLSVLVMTWT